MPIFPTGPITAAEHVPSLQEISGNPVLADPLAHIPTNPIYPVDPCAPVLNQLFGLHDGGGDLVGGAPL